MTLTLVSDEVADMVVFNCQIFPSLGWTKAKHVIYNHVRNENLEKNRWGYNIQRSSSHEPFSRHFSRQASKQTFSNHVFVFKDILMKFMKFLI